jgi:hypothetical protein
MVKKLILLFLCLNAVALLGFFFMQCYAQLHPTHANDIASPAEISGPVEINLQHRLFTVFEFPAVKNPPRALIIFGSGDGGWASWEEKTCRALQGSGCTVIGIDSAEYAKDDYDLDTIQADYTTIARSVLSAYPSSPPPVIVGGWSMGAAQAIAVAGGPHPPPGLVGLLLVSPMSRGRYGLRGSDRLDILPTGPGTFGVEDFTPNLNSLRVAQWHAVDDTTDSVAWLSNLKAPHREYDYPHVGHDYAGANPVFLQQLVESVAWILN